MNTERLRLALAETLLRTATSDAAAASIAGDLLEQHRRGGWRFATDLGSTLFALAAQSLAGRPLRSLGLLVVSAAFWCLCYVAIRLALAWPGWLTVTSGTSDCLAVGGARGVLLSGALMLAGLATGAAAAQLGRSGSAAVLAPLVACFLALGPTLALVELLGGTLTWHCLLTYLVITPVCYAFPLLLGTLLGRATRASGRAAPLL